MLRSNLIKNAGVLSALVISAPVMAEEEELSPWEGSAKLGFIFSKTTTRSLSVNTGATVSYDVDYWKHSAEFSSYYTDTEDNEDGTNKYKMSYGVEYSLTDRQFLYLTNHYEHDRFATYRHQLTIATGFGATLIDNGKTSLSVGAGPGYRFSQRQDFDPDFPKQQQDEVIANAFIDLSSSLTESLEYGGKINTDYGEANTSTNVKAYIKNQLIEDVSLLVDVEYIYNTVVASDQTKDEVYSTISLNYDL